MDKEREEARKVVAALVETGRRTGRDWFQERCRKFGDKNAYQRSLRKVFTQAIVEGIIEARDEMLAVEKV